MIERYCTPEMNAIWSREAKYQRWLEVELAVCQAWAEEGVIPNEDWEAIRSLASFDLARCDELEKETRHDLLAFVRNVSETVGMPAARWVHFGLTSYDVIDYEPFDHTLPRTLASLHTCQPKSGKGGGVN